MPATDRDSTRRTPQLLLIAAGVLLMVRVVLAITAPVTPSPGAPDASRADGADAIQWRLPGVGEAEAASTGKPLLYDFTADWCPPCRMMQREVFSDHSLARALEQVAVPVKVLDRQREDGGNTAEVAALQEQFRVTSFPTLIVYAPATGKFVSLEGYAGASRTRAWMLEQPVVLAASPAPAPLPVPGGR